MCGRACVKATRQVAGSMPKKLKGETEEKERKIKYNLQEKKKEDWGNCLKEKK